MKDNYDYDSLNFLLNINQNTKPKTFDTLINKQNDQFTNEAPFSEKDPNETISESEEENESNVEESQGQYTLDSEKQKNRKEKMEQGRWTNAEHRLFLEGLIKYGNEWKMVQKHIKTRSSTQARSHAQKFLIRIKKNIASERNPEAIKKKIHMIFKEEMQDDFKPDNLPLFLDKIMKLVFVSELGNKKHNNQSKEKKDDLIEESSSSSLDLESNNNKNLAIKLSDIDDILTVNERKRCLKKRKESFFSIEKDMDKINIKQLKTKLDKRIENKTVPNKNYYENYTQTIRHDNPHSYINIVNITMVNNSTNTYVQNYNGSNTNSKNSGLSNANVLNDKDKKKYSIRDDSNSNPFNLQFDELISQPLSMNNINNNYDMNDQDDEHLFANLDF